MSLFPVLEVEGELQLNDKTRFNAAKSFYSKATTPLTSLKIVPGVGASEIDVFVADEPNEWYLDWAFTTFAIDVDSTNNAVIFEEAGVEYTGAVASGTYTLAQYATAVALAMTNAAGSAGTYSGAVYESTKIRITSDVAFRMRESEVSTQGFFDIGDDVALAVTQTSDPIEYGMRIVALKVSNATITDTTIYGYLKVFTEEGDHLFCEDKDLTAHESDILKWVPEGRSSFKDVYRRAQKLIISWLDEKGYVNIYDEKFTKNDIVDIEEVRQWATFKSLKLIFQGNHNAVDDVFDEKAEYYEGLEKSAIQRTILRLDVDKDGDVEATEGASISSGTIFRR